MHPVASAIAQRHRLELRLPCHRGKGWSLATRTTEAKAGAFAYQDEARRSLRHRAAEAKAGAFAYRRLIRSKDLFSLSTACMSTVEGTPNEPGSWRKDFV